MGDRDTSDLAPFRCLRALDEIEILLHYARTDAVDLIERIERIAGDALAQAGEAGTAETQGVSVHEHAVAKRCAK